MNLWIVGKATLFSWECQGVFDDEDKAVAACIADSYFIGPAILNRSVDDNPIEWIGAYYPRLQEKPPCSGL
jgi:hypothetical protein